MSEEIEEIRDRRREIGEESEGEESEGEEC